MPKLVSHSLVVLLLAGCAHSPEAVDQAQFALERRAWHRERIEKLKIENGWLALAGLYWLKPGVNRIGSDPGNEIVFPEPAPARVGSVTLEGEKTRMKIEYGVEARCQDKPVEERELQSDKDGQAEPDRVVVGRFTFIIIKRGEKLALRLFDNKSKKRLEFPGIPIYPADPAWRLVARYQPYEQPKMLPFTTVIQTTTEVPIPGELVFEYAGREHRLLPISDPDSKELFIVFGDKTNGHETYGGGRFLYAPPPENSRVVLDFNRAVNPPCAFTRYATCPIPRPENRLPFKVQAGEKKYGDH